ncbi:PREDICTED: dual specificity protein phosphatase 19 [Chrysochloris asiatica]|uniref:Dual specificity protein phosphatase 19 n=1 Tax=Chrysochloris asiatica TaxID=185453 RepID=A0A9B0WPG1_CHRAS|nr:PREDICTED: dual specificity protein phosphatase 19 [Chrysochloris asiatica]
MQSLNQEIKAFSRNNLRKQCTRVTTLTGKKIIETWKDAKIHVVEEVEPNGAGDCGYVQDLSLDLQVGIIKPWLLLGSQDAAHDLDTLKKHKVTHILNVACGVENTFLSDFTYKSIPILDLPETNLLSYFPECFEFIEHTKTKDGVVLVHCNAGVSRAAAIVIGFLMNSEEISFTSAFSLVKNARPSICPNAGFMQQLRSYQENKEKSNKRDKIKELESDNSSKLVLADIG